VPELVEVELSRRLAERLIGRTIASVEVLDPHASIGDPGQFAAVLGGATFAAPRRIGKLLLLDTDRATLGMHFGMTGRVVVDGRPALDRLLYSSATLEVRWIRFVIGLSDGGRVELHDPRRLARVSVDPDDANPYGAHWYGVVGDTLGTFRAAGYEGQSITICPTLDLVVVRLGKTPLERKANLVPWRVAMVRAFAEAR